MGYGSKNPNIESTIYSNKAAASVANAPTGKVRIIQRDGKLLTQDDTGLEAELGAGSGGGINYFQNGRFETSITDGVTTGGTATTNTAETGSPLFDDQSINISSGAGNSTNDFAIADIDPAIIEGGILNYVSAYLKTDSAVAEGDWTVGIFNTTDAVYATTKTDLKANILNVHQAVFVPVTGKTYVLRVEFTDTTAGRILIVDQLTMTPESSTALQAFEQKTNWVDSTVCSVTFTNFSATLQQATFRVHRDANDQYYIDGEFRFNITVGTVQDSLEITLGLGGTTFSGIGAAAIASLQTQSRAADQFSNCFTGQNNTALKLFFSSSYEHNGETWSVNISNNRLNAKPSWFDDNLDDNKVNLITPNLLLSNAKSSWTLGTTTAVSVAGTFDFDTEDYNEGGFINDGAGVITIPADGKYRITVGVLFTTVPINSSALTLDIGGTVVRESNQAAGGNEGRSMYITWEGDILAGVDVKVTQFNQVSPAQSATRSGLTITRVADIGAHEPVGFGIATTDNFGLTIKPKTQTKFLGGSESTATVSVADLEFNNLTVGRTYRIVGYFNYRAFALGATQAIIVRIRNSATDNTNVIWRDSVDCFDLTASGKLHVSSAPLVDFVAVDTNLRVRIESVTNMALHGEATPARSSFLKVTDITGLEEITTDWT